MRRTLALSVLLVALLSACGSSKTAVDPAADPPSSSCVPSPGGRCAADVAWTGPMHVTADGLTLHGIVACGGTLHASETSDTVTVTLHVGALGPGMMSCARVDVGVTLTQPLGQRQVVDSVTGQPIQVAQH